MLIIFLLGWLWTPAITQAVEPSGVLISRAFNFNGRGLGLRQGRTTGIQTIKEGETQLRAYEDSLEVEGDEKSWASFVHILSINPWMLGKFQLQSIPNKRSFSYYFPCEGKSGDVLMVWIPGQKVSCREGFRRLSSEGRSQTDKNYFTAYNALSKSLLLAQVQPGIRLVPRSDLTLIRSTDTINGLLTQVIRGSLQIFSSQIPAGRVIQQGQQYAYPQDQITSFNADAAGQSPEVKNFMDEERWTTSDTPKPLSDAIKQQLQSYRLSPGSPTPTGTSRPVEVDSRVIKATIYLNSPETILKLAYSTTPQSFSNFVSSNSSAIVASGTTAVGNWQMISEGKQVAGNFRFTTGTVLGLQRGNQPEMVTLKKEGLPNWDNYWFALAAGPRLLKAGQILPWRPQEEGFADPKFTNTETALGRAAIGFSSDRTRLYYVLFQRDVSLRQAAEYMKQIGCVEAMNLEGGGTRSFAHNGKILVPGGRSQNHVLVVYDVNRPAPNSVKQSWLAFRGS